MNRIRIGLHGATGRMGQAVRALLDADDRLQLAAYAPDSNDKHAAFFEKLATPGAVDVVVDFSQPQAVVPLAQACAEAGVALVSGTTGLNAGEMAQLQALARQVAILWSPNMSRGVNLARRLVAQAARMLGEDWDVEVVEAHHRYKKDAPSGTALLLGQAAAEARGQDFDAVARLSREGRDCERRPGEIGFSTIRGGDVVGEHTVLFLADGERVEISHRIQQRSSFAAGALECALWLQGRPAGWYRFDDMLADKLAGKLAETGA